MSGKQKLELTWIGKDEQPRLEPRILIEDPTKSYGDKASQNMLIYGDNLLALKALEQDFASYRTWSGPAGVFLFRRNLRVRQKRWHNGSPA